MYKERVAIHMPAVHLSGLSGFQVPLLSIHQPSTKAPAMSQSSQWPLEATNIVGQGVSRTSECHQEDLLGSPRHCSDGPPGLGMFKLYNYINFWLNTLHKDILRSDHKLVNSSWWTIFESVRDWMSGYVWDWMGMSWYKYICLKGMPKRNTFWCKDSGSIAKVLHKRHAQPSTSKHVAHRQIQKNIQRIPNRFTILTAIMKFDLLHSLLTQKLWL